MATTSPANRSARWAPRCAGVTPGSACNGLWSYNTDSATGREKLLVSSIHQAKGLEAEVVYLLQPGLCPLQERLKLKDDPVRGWEAV